MNLDVQEMVGVNIFEPQYALISSRLDLLTTSSSISYQLPEGTPYSSDIMSAIQIPRSQMTPAILY